MQTALGPTSGDPVSKTTQALQGALPSGRAGVAGSAANLFGASLATGATPAASAQAFQRSYSTALGIDPNDLVPRDLKQGKAVASAAPQGIGLMYDQATGQPKFWLYRADQVKNGIKVYRSLLLTLVRNTPGNPVVWSSSSLRDLSGFVASAGLQAAAPDRNRSLTAIQGTSNPRGKALPLPQSITSLSQPEPVVFAGTAGHPAAPRMAIEYTATTAPLGSWHLVADASTGEVLHVHSLIDYSTITGSVKGKATQNDVAMECASAASSAFPFAEVTGPQPALTFGDANGSYALTGNFSGNVNVASPMLGTYFYVTNQVGSTETVSATVVPPATTANFLHNSAGTDELVTAQANAYVEANEIRSFVLKYLPYLSGVYDQAMMPIHVNLGPEDGDCPRNAWYNRDNILGNSFNFCRSGYRADDGETYSNTAFASIVHHEYTHHVIEMGAHLEGDEGAYGEGMSDSVALLFSGQHAHGVGVYLNQCSRARRDALNTCQFLPDPECGDCGDGPDYDIHVCAQVLSGAIWDLRENLKASNPTTYVDIVNNMVLSSILLRWDNIITAKIALDLLAVDDDDGILDNGTPHYNEICSAFAVHGMTCCSGFVQLGYECPAVYAGLGVSPLTGLTAEGPWGGPFAPSSVTYQVGNQGPNSSIQYQVTAPPGVTWLSITNGSGQLAIGHTAQVTVAINQAVAATLGKGPFDTAVQFTNLTDGAGNTTRAVHLAIGVAPIYTETFEGGLGSFSSGSGGSTTGLWHLSSACASSQPGHSLTKSLYFGIDSSCTYDNGQTVAGTATSGPITVSNIPSTSDTSIVRLHLNYFLATERGGYYDDSDYDQASVQISVNGGAYTVVASDSVNQGGAILEDGGTGWHSATIDLTPLVAGLSSATLRVRFTFDSLDNTVNAFTGFVVDDVQILALANQAPVVSVGSAQTITLPAAVNLTGTVTDDGLPKPPGTVTKTWSKVSGPGNVTFANPNAAATTATFSAAGPYVLKLTGNDSALSASATVAITVNAAPANKAPVVNAGSNQTITIPAAATLSGSVTDDGLPNPPAKVTITWSKVSGPGAVTFANPNVAATTAAFSSSGAYVLKLTGNDSALSTSATVVITVVAAPANKAPVVSAGSNQTITLPAAATLSGTVTDDGLPNPPKKVTITWSKASGPGTVTFGNASLAATTATFSASGTYVLTLTGNDSALSTSATVTITVNASGTTPCTGLCTGPTTFTISSGGSYNSPNLGTGAVCFETTSTITSGNCSNFVSPRVLKVNGTTEPCTNWSSVPAKRNGGYCIQTTTGNQSYATFAVW
jgi:hypothetical protein